MQSVNTQKKQIKIDDLNVSYKQIGSGSIQIVLLHGWGINSDKYLKLIEIMSKENTDLKIIVPDLPGFGKSDEPNENWNLDNYVEFVDKFIRSSTQDRGFELLKNILKKTNIKKIMNGGFSSVSNSNSDHKKQINLIGHSFGGRIAIKYAMKYPEKIDKLILTGAAGIKHRLTFKQKVFYFLAKRGKNIFSLPIIKKFQKYARKIIYKLAREKDYNQASPRMKEIMKNVLAEDLTLILEKIKTPTLLIWGRFDNSTPLSDGKIMNEKIENSKLIVINDANHSLPYQKPEEFVNFIKEFIKNDA
ncbi:MAG: alpha/beta hydrolase [Patescibacteria group bacterium]|nr:alpha/beta hydrolase [Patescibacteria group bacterium]